MTRPVIPEEWPDFHFFRNQVIGLAFESQLYQKLLGDNPDRVAELNARTGEFFHFIGNALASNVARKLAVLLDSPSTGLGQNLSIETIILQASCWVSQDTSHRCNQTLHRLQLSLKRLKNYRNKVLFHNDIKIATKRKQHPIVTHGEIRDLIKGIFEILNFIELDLFDSQTAYEIGIIKAPHDMFAVVNDALWHDELQRLVRKNEISEALAGKILRYGRRGMDWRAWCADQELDTDYYLPHSESNPAQS